MISKLSGPRRLGASAAVAALAIATFTLFVLPAATRLTAQEAPGLHRGAAEGSTQEDFDRLFNAVVERVRKSFWDKDRLASADWGRQVQLARSEVVKAPTREEAARRINALLGKLKTSHTGLLTPDDQDYYNLLDVFSGSRGARKLAKQFPSGVHYAGIGIFTVRIDDRHFVDAVLEGSPADRAGINVGDEVVNVDEAPFHPIRSFRGRIGQEASVAIRRASGGPIEVLRCDVVRVAPLRLFNDATLASARVIERDGGRIGYVHVWASFGDQSAQSLKAALAKLNVEDGVAREAKSETSEQDGRADTVITPPLDALIIDMRGKIGGTGTTAARYLDLIDPRGPRVRSRNKRDGAQASVSLRGRSAILIDSHTRSTAELFVHAYRRERQGPLVGTPTAGAVSAAAAFAMPGGNLLYLAVMGLEVDGEVLEGQGVAPDIAVQRPLPYSNASDPVLDVALAELAKRASSNLPAAGALAK
jgi:carboxyl-terminal processing protease